MKIDHIAIWVNDLEKMKDFYVQYFKLKCSEKYVNQKKGFSSYFVSFDSGANIELMHQPDIARPSEGKHATKGIAHFAISLGNKKNVDQLTELFRKDGYEVVGEPRTTGDGFYESVILDPEGNMVELTE